MNIKFMNTNIVSGAEFRICHIGIRVKIPLSVVTLLTGRIRICVTATQALNLEMGHAPA